MSSYNNQLMYKPDYSYAEALTKFNPMKNLAEPFEKMEAKKASDAKAALEANVAKATIDNKVADTAGKKQDNIDKPLINQATIDNKKADTAGKDIDNAYKPLTAQAGIDEKEAKTFKLKEETKTIAPKAEAELARTKAETFKVKTQSGLLVPEHLLSKEYKAKQMQKWDREHENEGIKIGQAAYRNTVYDKYVDALGKKKKQDNETFGE